MILDLIPIWAFSLGVVCLVLLAVELGYRIGKSKRLQVHPDSESLVSLITGSVLGLLGFVLAFTFGIVYNRFQQREDLVREEANAIRRVWLRSDFMPEPDHSKTVSMLKEYLELRIEAAQGGEMSQLTKIIQESDQIQRRLWDLAVTNGKQNLLSGLTAPYLQSLNDLIDIHGRRLAVGVQDRIPVWIWVALGTLLLLSMVSIGYMTAIKSTHRSSMTIVLAISFSIMFLLISALDRPLTGMFKASQKPLLTLKELMAK